MVQQALIREFEVAKKREEGKNSAIKKAINLLTPIIKDINKIDQHVTLQIATIDYLKECKVLNPDKDSNNVYDYSRPYGILKVYDRDYIVDFASDTEIVFVNILMNKFSKKPITLKSLFVDNEEAYTFDLSEEDEVNEFKSALISTIAACHFKDNLIPEIKGDAKNGKTNTRDGVTPLKINRNLRG